MNRKVLARRLKKIAALMAQTVEQLERQTASARPKPVAKKKAAKKKTAKKKAARRTVKKKAGVK